MQNADLRPQTALHSSRRHPANLADSIEFLRCLSESNGTKRCRPARSVVVARVWESVEMFGHQLLCSVVKGAISLQNDVLGSEGTKKVHQSPEVIEIRKFCPPNQIRAFFIFLY